MIKHFFFYLFKKNTQFFFIYLKKIQFFFIYLKILSQLNNNEFCIIRRNLERAS